MPNFISNPVVDIFLLKYNSKDFILSARQV